MEDVRKIQSGYDLEDMYNTYESGYLFQMQPDLPLCTEQLEGIKKDKSRVTIVLTCNGKGTDILPP